MQPKDELKKAVSDYKNGDNNAFTRLYNESVKYVYTCVYKVMSGNDNVQDAVDDIMQDTYLEISKYIFQLEDEEKFLSWAGTIATRKCYAYLKKNNRYILLNDEDTTFETLADNDNIIPEAVFQDKEKQRIIREIIDNELTQIQKLCITAFYYNGQKQSEIAKELDIPENTVKTNISRAKAKIEKAVVGTEKRDGIRLHSIAPFMLLLFNEDVYAAVVPESTTKGVYTSVSASLAKGMAAEGVGSAVATGGKVMAKKAVLSLQAKIICAIAGTGIIGASVGTAVYMITQDKSADDDSLWTKAYSDYLLENKEITGFDLNDFDEDKIPELVIKKEDNSISICRYESGKVEKLEELVPYANATRENGIEEEMICIYGYGMNYDEIIEIDEWTGIYEDEKFELETAILYRYHNQKLNQIKVAAPSITGSLDSLEIGYLITEGMKNDIASIEEGKQFTDELKNEFNEIIYTKPEKEKIEKRIKDFITNGNRKRYQNNTADEDESKQNEAVEITETVTEEEKEKFRLLAQFFTATKWGEDLSGEKLIPTSENVAEFVGRLSNDNLEADGWPLDKYLPEKIKEEEYRQVYTMESMKKYAKSVFGIEFEKSDASCLREENGKYTVMEAQYTSADMCVTDKVVKEGKNYIITGKHAFGYYDDVEAQEPVYMKARSFEMVLAENDKSPFGYTLISISYENIKESKIKEVLLYPTEYIEYYGNGTKLYDIWFAVADIDKDGNDEVFIADEAYENGFVRICNVLKYDEETNEVTDVDGDADAKYIAIGTEQTLYDTGILKTSTGMTTNNTYFWNLFTGECWHGPQHKAANENVPFSETETYTELTCPDGSIVSKDEAKKLYESLMSGEEIPLTWYKATVENVNRYIK